MNPIASLKHASHSQVLVEKKGEEGSPCLGLSHFDSSPPRPRFQGVQSIIEDSDAANEEQPFASCEAPEVSKDADKDEDCNAEETEERIAHGVPCDPNVYVSHKNLAAFGRAHK